MNPGMLRPIFGEEVEPMTQESITQIVIAGGGTAGWMTAAALVRFLGDGVRVTLVESDAIGTVGVGEATIPQIHHFNGWLGIDEADFVRATKATFKLGIEFDGWHRPNECYMHAFGVVGRAFGIAPFRHGWLRARRTGNAEAYGAYSFNEVAARAGRFARPEAGRPGLVYAYHFDAGLYAAYLRNYAEARGVTRVEGRILSVERDSISGDVSRLLLDNERAVSGQLFVDCSGFRGLLIGDAMGVPYLDWSGFLPCDRALAVPCERGDIFRPYTQSMARPAGWQWRIPLQHRTGNGHVYCSAFTTDDQAAALLLANLDGVPLDDPRPLQFRTGRRERTWEGNVVALGLAAGFMEPLESTSIHLIQSAIGRLLTYFPRRTIDSAVRAAYNCLTVVEWERIRDFLIAHYRFNERHGEAFWDMCRTIEMPDSLAEKIEIFRATGQVHRDQDELFTEEGWSQVLIGQGVEPVDWHPAADLVDAGELSKFLASMADAYKRRAEQLPMHNQYVEQLCLETVR